MELEYFEAIRKHSISLAPRKIRGRSAEDPRGSQGSWGTGWAPSKGMIDFPVRGGRAPGEIIDFSFYLHCGRSAEDPRGSRGSRSTPGHQLPNFAHRPQRKIRGRHRGSHLVPPAPFRAAGPVFQHCGLQVAPLGGGLPGGHRVAGHRVATNSKKTVSPAPRKIRGRCAEDPRKTPAEVIFE